MPDEGHLLLKKHKFPIDKLSSNSAAEFAAIRLIYNQLCGDNRIFSIMLLASKLKHFLGHDVNLSIMQQPVAHWCTSQSIMYHIVSLTRHKSNMCDVATELCHHAAVSPVCKHTVHFLKGHIS